MITEIEQFIAMYAPTILLAIGTILNYVKLFRGLRQNASNIMNDPKMVALKEELDSTKEELELMRSQIREMVRRQGELINELSKVVKYEDNGKNQEM